MERAPEAVREGWSPWVLSCWEVKVITTRIHFLCHCQNSHDLLLDDWMVEHGGNDECTYDEEKIHRYSGLLEVSSLLLEEGGRNIRADR